MPKALDPLRYCEYRIVDYEREVTICGTFAGALVKGMAMCEAHGESTMKALEDFGVELVKGLELVSVRKEA